MSSIITKKPSIFTQLERSGYKSNIMVPEPMRLMNCKSVPREMVIQAHANECSSRGKKPIVYSLECSAPKELLRRPISNYIDKIGVELEGRWNHNNNVQPEKQDGSLRFDINEDNESCDCSSLCGCGDDNCDECNGDYEHNPVVHGVGEIATAPYQISNTYQWEVALGDISNLYPDKVNSSCGMHIHMSFFDNGAYNALTCSEFNDYFIDSLLSFSRATFNRNSRLINRLTNGNYYCETNYGLNDKYMARDFMRGRPVNRYYAVNYDAIRAHGTIEFRVLPMFDRKESALKAITATINIVSHWLDYMLPISTIASVEEEDEPNVDEDFFALPQKTTLSQIPTDASERFMWPMVNMSRLMPSATATQRCRCSHSCDDHAMNTNRSSIFCLYCNCNEYRAAN